MAQHHVLRVLFEEDHLLWNLPQWETLVTDVQGLCPVLPFDESGIRLVQWTTFIVCHDLSVIALPETPSNAVFWRQQGNNLLSHGVDGFLVSFHQLLRRGFWFERSQFRGEDVGQPQCDNG